VFENLLIAKKKTLIYFSLHLKLKLKVQHINLDQQGFKKKKSNAQESTSLFLLYLNSNHLTETKVNDLSQRIYKNCF
jgi:hypothetical protein